MNDKLWLLANRALFWLVTRWLVIFSVVLSAYYLFPYTLLVVVWYLATAFYKLKRGLRS